MSGAADHGGAAMAATGSTAHAMAKPDGDDLIRTLKAGATRRRGVIEALPPAMMARLLGLADAQMCLKMLGAGGLGERLIDAAILRSGLPDPAAAQPEEAGLAIAALRRIEAMVILAGVADAVLDLGPAFPRNALAALEEAHGREIVAAAIGLLATAEPDWRAASDVAPDPASVEMRGGPIVRAALRERLPTLAPWIDLALPAMEGASESEPADAGGAAIAEAVIRTTAVAA